jgi:hypothetical protein
MQFASRCFAVCEPFRDRDGIARPIICEQIPNLSTVFQWGVADAPANKKTHCLLVVRRVNGVQNPG